MTETPKHKQDFLRWLERFSRIPRGLRHTLVTYSFSEAELDALRPQIEQKFKLKTEYLKRRGA